MSHSSELEIIRFIQEFRNPILDGFFKCLDFFDRQEFFFILIPAVWLGKGWKWGIRLFYILFLSSLINHALKEFFLSPRPFHIDPSVGIIQVGRYGFPSGAAQTVILLSGLLLNFWKSSWKWSVVFFYIAFVSFSRVYLGIHFPTDILGGWVVGLTLWALFTYVRPTLEVQLEKLKPLSLFLLSQFIPILLLFWQYSPSALRSSAYTMGMGAIGIGIGLFINHSLGWSLAPSKTRKEFTRRAMIGVIGTFLCYFFVSLLPLPQSSFAMFCKFLFLSLWITTGSLLLCRKLFPSSKFPLKVK
jgi:undecaprenyl-diphosphatase